MIVRAIVEETAQASGAHLSEGDLDRAGHTAIEAWSRRIGNRPSALAE
jgi:hypothetical protein